MSKINTVLISNAKAVADFTADFKGMTVMVTGANNIGKSTILRSLFDRIRGIKPDQILKQGEDAGFIENTLDTGEKLRWEFNDKGKEKLVYTSDKNIKSPLTVELRNRFLPETFDVDEFLQATPMAQRKTLQKLAGIDFTALDASYKIAYDERAAANKSHNDARVKFEQTEVAPKVEPVSMEVLIAEKQVIVSDLNAKYLANKKVNDDARKAWNEACELVRQEVAKHNRQQEINRQVYNAIYDAAHVLRTGGFINDKMEDFVKVAKDCILADKVVSDLLPVEPTYIEELPARTALDEKDAQIQAANETNRKAQQYKDWVAQKDALSALAVSAKDADTKVVGIERERMDLIKTANMPEGFTFSDDGILYNGLPFTRTQLSSSGIYIGALKLASLKLGEIRCLHFDASFLDKKNLLEIEAWANAQDLQLLIERPAYDGGEIVYELIEG